MGRHSIVAITYVPGDETREYDPTDCSISAEQEIYEANITSDDISTAIVDAGKKLMKTMGFADFNSNQIAYLDWDRYPSVKPSEYYINKTLLVAIFNNKTKTLETVSDSWNGVGFNKYDPIVLYWTLMPDPPVKL